MSLESWLALAGVCLLGAMSPGPSLAVVLRSALVGGRAAGITTSLAHALGVGLYALVTVLGIATLITLWPPITAGIQAAGAVYLVYLGIAAMRASLQPRPDGPEPAPAPVSRPAHQGLLIALLNPKLAVFMFALFSQFLTQQASGADRAGMVLVAAGIDAAWYVAVVLLMTGTGLVEALKRKAQLVDRAFAAVLILLGCSMLVLLLVRA